MVMIRTKFSRREMKGEKNLAWKFEIFFKSKEGMVLYDIWKIDLKRYKNRLKRYQSSILKKLRGKKDVALIANVKTSIGRKQETLF